MMSIVDDQFVGIGGYPTAIAVDASGGAFVAGSPASYGVSNTFLARLAPDGSAGFYSTLRGYGLSGRRAGEGSPGRNDSRHSEIDPAPISPHARALTDPPVKRASRQRRPSGRESRQLKQKAPLKRTESESVGHRR